MGYCIWMGLDGVQVDERKAEEAVALLGAKGLLDPALTTGDPVEVLCGALDHHGFGFERSSGFINIEDWNNGERGNSRDQDEAIVALGPIFEAGGTIEGDGEQGERWEYRFIGGSYELGWGTQDKVSAEDKDRVTDVWTAIRSQVPEEAREVIEAALARAEYLRSERTAA